MYRELRSSVSFCELLGSLVLVVAAACSSPAGKIVDATLIDAAHAEPDSNPFCSVEAQGPEPAVWTAEIVWDREIASTSTDTTFDYGVFLVAPDADGISTFTNNSFVRTDLSGERISEVPYPENRLIAVESGAGHFALVFQENAVGNDWHYLLCIVPPSGEFEIGQCTELADKTRVPQPTWDGENYLFLSTDAAHNIVVLSFNSSASLVETRVVLPPINEAGGTNGLELLGQDLVVYAINADEESSCGSSYAALIPAGETGDSFKTILPEHYVGDSSTASASSADSSMYVGNVLCASRINNSCRVHPETKVGVASVMDREGTIKFNATRAPLGFQHQLFWDGEFFVDFVQSPAQAEDNLQLYLLDDNGQTKGHAILPGAYDSPALQLVERSALGVLAPQDYLIGYSILGSEQHRLMRVRLAPP